MRFVSGAFSWAFALIPTAYIGALLWYFTGVGGGTTDGIVGIGLGPTVMGLTFVGIILALPVIIELIRLLTGANRVPGAAAAGEPSIETAGFDADAAFANYMRNRDTASPPPIATDAVNDDLRPFAPRPGGFGRKGV